MYMKKKQLIALISVIAVVLLSRYAYFSVCKLRWIPPQIVKTQVLGSISFSANGAVFNYPFNAPDSDQISLLLVLRDGMGECRRNCSSPDWNVSCNISLAKGTGGVLLEQMVASNRMQYANWFKPDTAVLLAVDKFSETLNAGAGYSIMLNSAGAIETTNQIDVVLHWLETPNPRR